METFIKRQSKLVQLTMDMELDMLKTVFAGFFNFSFFSVLIILSFLLTFQSIYLSFIY